MKRKINYNYNYNYDDNYLYFQVIENIVSGQGCPDTSKKRVGEKP